MNQTFRTRLRPLDPVEIDHVASLQWRHKIPVGFDSKDQIVWTNGLTDFEDDMTRVLALPENLTGKSVLDIGTSDGLVAFECEARGAHVVPFDLWTQIGFELAAKLIDSKLTMPLLRDVQVDGYPFLSHDWDVILCLGLIYHVQNPFRVFELMRKAIKPTGIVLIETEIVPFFDGEIETVGASWTLKRMFGDDPTNYWFPTEAGLIDTARVFGFSAERKWSNQSGRRMTFQLTPI